MHPFERQSVAQLLETRAALSRERTFLTWAPFEGRSRRWTYGEFAHDVARVASGLAQRGVKRGDRVVVLMENCPEVLLTFFACAWLGAVCVPVNAASTAPELAYFLERTRAVGLVTQARLLAAIEAAVTSQWMVTDASFGELLAQPMPRVEVGSSDPAAILFTSGTTSRPKGVVWTQANVLWGARMGVLQEGLRSDDVHLVFLPLFHVVALTWSVLPAIWSGASCVLQPRFSASRFWDAAVEHRCTWASMVPFCTAVLARQPIPPGHHFRMWGHAFYSSDYEKLFGVKLMGWWGMTEIVTMGLVGDPSLAQTPRTIGRPSVGYRIAVVDENGRACAPGEPGELRVGGECGVSIFLEYVDDPAATQAAFDEQGLFRTGDRVKVREDGTIEFIDRTKDVIKVGGENVAAPEVERVIAAVKGVREVAVVARRDPVLGEVPVAFVMADEAGRDAGFVERVLAACRVQLARFKVPRDVLVVDDFPRVAIGKISKAELRRRLE
ncbi:MAG TPA: AMP-binding protein [Usitatibacter sp.]|nr:AMP-binding protein [Usitatibacter sp.]